MHTRSKLLLAGLTAALVLSMAIASASANRLSVSNRNFRIVWTPLEFIAESVATPIRCNVTLEGSFHSSTIVKTVGVLIGQVTRGTLNSCSGGTATINQEALPWHVQYGGFTGTLPTITGVSLRLIGAKFTVDPEGSTPACTTVTTTTNPAIGIANISAGTITGLRADEEAPIPLRGGFICEIAGNGFFAGIGRVTVLGSTTAIRVTLI